jgi:hypothetical protein
MSIRAYLPPGQEAVHDVPEERSVRGQVVLQTRVRIR